MLLVQARCRLLLSGVLGLDQTPTDSGKLISLALPRDRYQDLLALLAVQCGVSFCGELKEGPSQGRRVASSTAGRVCSNPSARQVWAAHLLANSRRGSYLNYNAWEYNRPLAVDMLQGSTSTFCQGGVVVQWNFDNTISQIRKISFLISL